MEILHPKKLKSRSTEIISQLEEVKNTQEFLNPERPEILELCVLLTLQNDPNFLYQKLKQLYIKQQSNEDLEYLTILAAYSSGKYSECLFLAQDLLVSRQTPEIFYIILKICINKLSLSELAMHYSSLSLKHHPDDAGLSHARAVVCIYTASSTIYYQSRVKLLKEAKDLLSIYSSSGRNSLFFKGLVHAHLNELPEALHNAGEGLRITMESNYSALLALVMLAQEDFTGAIAVAKRGLKANPCNLLLYAVK